MFCTENINVVRENYFSISLFRYPICNRVRLRLILGPPYRDTEFSEVARAKATLQVRSRRLLTDLTCLRDSLAASIFRRFMTARATVLTEEISNG